MPASTQRRDTCPWCSELITDAHDPVVLDPQERHADAHRLHRDCATEWVTFLDDARALATSGVRRSLLDAPLEQGYDLKQPEVSTGRR